MRSHKGKGRILATDRLMSAGTLKRTSESMRNFPTACQLVLSPPSGLFPRSLAFSLSLAVPPLPRHQFQSPCLTSRSANNTPPRVSPPSPRPTVPPPRPHVASVTQDLCMSPVVSCYFLIARCSQLPQWSVLICVHDAHPVAVQLLRPRHLGPRGGRRHGTRRRRTRPAARRHVGIRLWQHLWRNR